MLPAVVFAGISCGDDPGGPDNQQPITAISSPPEGATFVEGEAVPFSGTATDPEDGSLAGAELVWSSEIDGQIGTGSAFSRDDLSPGTHEITLTVSDGDGLSANARTSITIVGNDAPHAVISAPPYGAEFGVGTSIEFSGFAADPEDGDLAAGSLVWTSDLDGEIGTGSDFSRDDLTVGEHLIRLIATDESGRTDTASVRASVRSADSIRVFPHIIVIRENATRQPFIQPLFQGEPVVDPTLTLVSRDPTVAWVTNVPPVGPRVGYESLGVTDVVVTTSEVADSIRVGAIAYGGYLVHVSREEGEFVSEATPSEIVRLRLRVLRADIIGDLGALEGAVLWDPSVLSYQSSTVVEPDWSWSATLTESQQLTFEASTSDGTEEPFELAELEFAVVGEAGDSSPLTVRIDSAALGDGTAIVDWGVSVMDGTLEVR